MDDSWTCLMVQNGPGILPDDVRTALKIAACQMNLSKKDRISISNDVCVCVVETEWDTYGVGSRSGVLFRAQITTDTSGGDFKVNFLLNREDLKRGAKLLRAYEEGKISSHLADGPIPVEVLYEFHDLQKPKRTLH